MPKKSFDTTALQNDLNLYINELSDLMTSSDEVDKYVKFTSSVFAINAMLKNYYTPDSEGKLPLLDEKMKRELCAEYSKAIKEGTPFLNDEDSGVVGQQMKHIISGMMPQLQVDLETLSNADARKKITLPELISKGRSQAVDIGDRQVNFEETPSINLTINNGQEYEEGTFYPHESGTAVYRMAEFLGKPNLVSETRPVTLIQNGVPVPGTFTSKSYKTDTSKLNLTNESYKNPAVYDDIAAIQAILYICGNSQVISDKLNMRFEPQNKEARLTGITLAGTGDAFVNTGSEEKEVDLSLQKAGLGVIGEDLYNALRVMTKEQMELALADCKIPSREIDLAWERKEQLLQKIETDKKFYKDKVSGFTESGRIRVVPSEEWEHYSIPGLAANHPGGIFNTIIQTQNEIQEEGPVNEAPAIEGNVVGNGLVQKQEDNLIADQDDTVKLVVPDLAHVNHVGNFLSKRYCLSYKDGDKTKEVFYTLPSDSGTRVNFIEIMNEQIDKHPEYRDVLIPFKDFYITDDKNIKLPVFTEEFKFKEMGIPEARADELKHDHKFSDVLLKITSSVDSVKTRNYMLSRYGGNIGEGKRVELRNVAMSDVDELLSDGKLLAKSRPVQIMCNGKVVDGVIMDSAEGENFFKMKGNHPVAQIPSNKYDEAFNTEEGLKSLADLQILDYICLNVDRHEYNMFYKFEGLGTDHPKFIGVQGIDNDCSLGSKVPKYPDETTNHLMSIDDMKVITEEMAAKVMNPELGNKVAEKLKLRGLSDAEADAAKQRIEQIKRAINEKKIRVVKNGEWGKGENSLSELGEEYGTFFHTVDNAFKVAVKMGKNYNKKPADQREPYDPKKPKFSAVLKVDDFGENVLNNKEFIELQKKAQKEFAEKTIRTAESAPQDTAVSERAFLQQAYDAAVSIYDQLDKANPVFHRTSSTYKKLEKAGKELKNLTKKLKKKLRTDADELSPKDTAKLKKMFNKLTDAAAAYNLKKAGEIQNGKHMDDIEDARMEASSHASFNAQTLMRTYESVLVSQLVKKNPTKLVNYRLQQSQSRLSGLTGENLRRKVADVIYYKGLARIDNEKKKSAALKNAVQPSVVEQQAGNIMNEPAFKKLAEMPDKELRTLAAGKGAEKLMNTFIRETAKHMQQEKAKQNANKNRNEKKVENKPDIQAGK